jgi:hypothetical protein
MVWDKGFTKIYCPAGRHRVAAWFESTMNRWFSASRETV